MRTYKTFLSCLWILATIVLCLPAQTGRAEGETIPPTGVKITDTGGLLAGHAVILPVTVTNTGSNGDQYTITYQRDPCPAAWIIAINGQVVNQYTTGNISSLGSQTLQVRFTAPPEAALGDYCQIHLTATSNADPSTKATALVQGAISAPFVQMFSDPMIGRELQVANTNLQFTRNIGPQNFYFSALMVTHINHFRYINSWIYSLGSHSNIEYEVMDVRSSVPASVVQLTDNQGSVVDHDVSMAVAPNLTTGVVFIRTLSRDDSTQNQNVYFGRILANGLPPENELPKQITLNGDYGASATEDPSVEFFSAPSIRATANNRFILTWLMIQNSVQDVYEAIFEANGNQVGTIQKLTNMVSPATCTASSLTGLRTNGQAFLTYMTKEDSDSPSITQGMRLYDDKVGHVDLISLDSLAIPIVDIDSSMIDTVQLPNGNIVAAWIAEESLVPSYAVWGLNGNVINVVKTAFLLPSPDGKIMNQIAVTYDNYNHGIITWGNTDPTASRAYYALVDGGTGTLITPPIIQRTAASKISLGSSIFSTAFLEDPLLWDTYIPAVIR